ncbi:MAG TPA: STAS domain-containing protein [Polyangiaceae bacterium]|jgi:anti-sigma B factor antagonist|nr:STAS domain-containing protein [Polyangiaceae bacterium]
MNFSRIDEGKNSTLRVRGELDALSAPELRPTIDELVESEQGDITVDLSGLRLVDSSGVGALVSLYKRVRARGGEVRFIGVTAQPLVIFKLLRLDAVFGLAAESPQAETDDSAQKLPGAVRIEN